MSTYKNFKYVPMNKKDSWKVTFPSGWSTIICANTEEHLKIKIDELINLFEGGDAG